MTGEAKNIALNIVKEIYITSMEQMLLGLLVCYLIIALFTNGLFIPICSSPLYQLMVDIVTYLNDDNKIWLLSLGKEEQATFIIY